MRASRALIALAAAVSTALLVPARAARAEEKAAIAPLLQNAWYWQARGRSDKAEDAWKKVLEAEPESPEAIAALGGFHARAGRADKAREALAHLLRVSPGHPDVPVLRRQLELGAAIGGKLARARKLVHEGHPAEGVAAYRALFAESGPPGDLALEYFQTVGGAPGGFAEARDGLSRIVRRAPKEPRFRLALGKLLTYREQSRAEGLRLLEEISRDPSVGKEASAAWREALLWLPPVPRSVPLLRPYAQAHPKDAEVAARIEQARKAQTLQEGTKALQQGELSQAERVFKSAGKDGEAKRGLALLEKRRVLEAEKQGFAALERGDLPLAEERFHAAGDDESARLGLALVAQREAILAQRREDFPRAQVLLEQAQRLVPERRDIWEEPLRSVRFWGLMREARDARAAGRLQESEGMLLDALDRASPADRFHADLALGDLLAQQKQPRLAEARYREVLATKPDQPDALRALAGILVQENRLDEAVPVNERLARVAPQKAFNSGWLQAQVLRASAARHREAHDLPRAITELTQARAKAPDDLWVLHDLANLQLSTGALAAAEPLVAQLLQLAPALPEARVTLARLLVAQRADAKALLVLEAIDPPPADPSVQALRRQLEVRVRIPKLLEAARRGERDAAVRGLMELTALSQAEPDLAAQVAVAWSRLGEHQRGIALMREAVAKSPSATRGARLTLASTLLDAGDEAAVGELLAGLTRDGSLAEPERRALLNLRVAHAVRLADRQREEGQPAAAVAALEPLLRETPDDVRLQGALARALEHADAARANSLYLAVLNASPDDVDALRGAVDTALRLGGGDEARALASQGVRRHPTDARVQLLAARVALRDGDDGAAMSLLSQALGLAGPAQTEIAQRTAGGEPGTSVASLSAGPLRLASASDQLALREQIEREMAQVRARHRPAFAGGFEARRRDGESGLSGLDEWRASLEAEVPVSFSGQAALHVSEVQLDAGNIAPYAGPRFGSGGPNVSALGPAQHALGTELRLTYEGRNVDAAVGTTPIGFPLFSPLGFLRLHAPAGPFSFALEGGRKSVTESLLSYAGATDPVTGRHFGGVVLDGGRLDLGVSGAPGSIYAYGELGRVIGFQVQDNLRGAAGGGVDVTIASGDFGQLSAGPTVATLAFERNLRFFTLGHGGYFSPQRFLHGGLALKFRRTGAVNFDAAAEPGYDTFTEAVTPALPLSPADQQHGLAPYLGQRKGGASFNGHAALGLRLGESWETGFNFSLQRAPEFQELRGGVFLKVGLGGAL